MDLPLFATEGKVFCITQAVLGKLCHVIIEIPNGIPNTQYAFRPVVRCKFFENLHNFPKFNKTVRLHIYYLHE